MCVGLKQLNSSLSQDSSGIGRTKVLAYLNSLYHTGNSF